MQIKQTLLWQSSNEKMLYTLHTFLYGFLFAYSKPSHYIWCKIALYLMQNLQGARSNIMTSWTDCARSARKFALCLLLIFRPTITYLVMHSQGNVWRALILYCWNARESMRIKLLGFKNVNLFCVLCEKNGLIFYQIKHLSRLCQSYFKNHKEKRHALFNSEIKSGWHTL